MLTLKYITENTAEVVKRLSKKNFDGELIINQVVELDSLRKSTQTQLDNQAAEMNNISKEIGLLFKQGKQAEAAAAKEKTTELKDSIKLLDNELSEIELSLNNLLVQIPNLPHESVPAGKHAEDNLIERTGGFMPNLPEGCLLYTSRCV